MSSTLFNAKLKRWVLSLFDFAFWFPARNIRSIIWKGKLSSFSSVMSLGSGEMCHCFTETFFSSDFTLRLFSESVIHSSTETPAGYHRL